MEDCIFFDIMWMARYMCIASREHDKGCKPASAAIHVDVTLTCTAYLSIVADHLQPFMEMVFTIGCGSFQQDNVPSHKAKTGMV